MVSAVSCSWQTGGRGTDRETVRYRLLEFGAPVARGHNIAACGLPTDRPASLVECTEYQYIRARGHNGLRLGQRQGTSQQEEARCRLQDGGESVPGSVCDRV